MKDQAEPEEEASGDRVEELKRRNTLCLPHLKSSYPMELSVDDKKNVEENVLKTGSLRKRKNWDTSQEAPRGTFKKWKTDQSMANNTFETTMSRSVKSDTNLPREELSPMRKSKMKPSVSYEISIDPPKNPNPRMMTRTRASGNLMSGKTEPYKKPVKGKTSPIKKGGKDKTNNKTNELSKRSSFSKAKDRMATLKAIKSLKT